MSEQRVRTNLPKGFPRWAKKCDAAIPKRNKRCERWAAVGLPTCRLHGSGGDEMAQLGRLRYLAWIVVGGPQRLPVSDACNLALATVLEMCFKFRPSRM